MRAEWRKLYGRNTVLRGSTRWDMSVQQEGKTSAEGEEDDSPRASGTALVLNSGERMSVEDLMRCSSVTTGRGLQPPSLDGKPLSRDNVKTFLTDNQGYASRMTEGVVDGIPKRPASVCELMDEDQRRVLRFAYNED